jgi:hypothetical protein
MKGIKTFKTIRDALIAERQEHEHAAHELARNGTQKALSFRESRQTALILLDCLAGLSCFSADAAGQERRCQCSRWKI